MNRAFCTGDIHGSLSRIETLCKQENTTREDYLVICGDLGLNYFLDERDAHVKNKLAKMPITIIGIPATTKKERGIFLLINEFIMRNYDVILG